MTLAATMGAPFGVYGAQVYTLVIERQHKQPNEEIQTTKKPASPKQ